MNRIFIPMWVLLTVAATAFFALMSWRAPGFIAYWPVLVGVPVIGIALDCIISGQKPGLVILLGSRADVLKDQD